MCVLNWVPWLYEQLGNLNEVLGLDDGNLAMVAPRFW